MKKLCAAWLAVCLMLMCPAAALAEETETIGVSVATVQAEADAESAVVRVSLSDCAGMDSIQLRLNYDQTCMRLTAVDAGDLLSGGLHVLNTETSGLLILAFASAEGLRQNEGTLIDLKFTLVNEAGSALTVTEVLATRYDAEANLQSKAYVTVEDGGVTFASDGTLPAAVITPWPVETPAPTPEPTPEPTAVPVSAPSTEMPAAEQQQAESAAQKKTGGTPLILILMAAAALTLFGIAAWLIVSDRKKKKEAERKAALLAERLAEKRAAQRRAQLLAEADSDIEEVLPEESEEA